MAQNSRIPHAQLLLGPAGSAKLALAIAFAQYLLCANRGTEDSCGQCGNCKRTEKFIHPDLHFSFPVIGSKMTSNHYLEEWRNSIADNPYLDVNAWLQSIGAENKQGNINKDECLNIIKKLNLKSFESNYKILILWLPEYLQKEGNRLLKLIEEPPENTIFLLVAEDSEQILNTILSRCQLVKVKSFSDEEVASELLGRGIPQSKAQSVAQLVNGNLSEAFALSKNQENSNAALFIEWLRKCYKGERVPLVKWTENFAKIGRENQKYFLQYGLHFMREYMVLKLTGAAQVRLQTDELATAQNLSKVIEFDQIEAITSLFNDCAYYVERNANPKILFLDASIKMHGILRPEKLARA